MKTLKAICFVLFVFWAIVTFAQTPAPTPAQPGFNPPPPDMNMIQNMLTQKNNTIDGLMLQIEQYKVQIEQLKHSVEQLKASDAASKGKDALANDAKTKAAVEASKKSPQQ